jgi:hypothetical protein
MLGIYEVFTTSNVSFLVHGISEEDAINRAMVVVKIPRSIITEAVFIRNLIADLALVQRADLYAMYFPN